MMVEKLKASSLRALLYELKRTLYAQERDQFLLSIAPLKHVGVATHAASAGKVCDA